ncbi:vWA domain-containing protein [Adhaeribacter aquaticus]|uniref:vWA domain-containing protein n=1 Tax=Adhaeribacter aquaticus TaxID=299567 RepID=UPI00047EBCC3|nr:VWA domain-containing protein [Adhaeribacter aquaticus]
MSWYQTLSWLEIIFVTIFILLYVGYIIRIKKLALYFKQKANTVYFKLGLRSFYFILLLVALLGPSFGAMTKEIKTLGKDIFILVDLSASMDANDVSPSRLEKIKFELNQLIPALNADRIGLITFTSEAYLQCPLTYDESALLLFTRILNTQQLPVGGANYFLPLEMALQRFQNRIKNPLEQNKARVVLLISDGEDFSPNLGPLLQRMVNNNIQVFTLGVGTQNGSSIPVGKSYKKDDNGNLVISHLQPDRLKDIARIAGGQYYEVNEKVNQTEKLLQEINNLLGTHRETRSIDITANKYMYPLLLALLLIVADVLITVAVIKI